MHAMLLGWFPGNLATRMATTYLGSGPWFGAISGVKQSGFTLNSSAAGAVFRLGAAVTAIDSRTCSLVVTVTSPNSGLLPVCLVYLDTSFNLQCVTSTHFSTCAGLLVLSLCQACCVFLLRSCSLRLEVLLAVLLFVLLIMA